MTIIGFGVFWFCYGLTVLCAGLLITIGLLGGYIFANFSSSKENIGKIEYITMMALIRLPRDPWWIRVLYVAADISVSCHIFFLG